MMAVSATVALSLSVAACGDDSGSGGDSSDALSGVSLTVGSKDFTENILLGEMFAQALENAGADVENKVNLGGTSVNRDALVSDNIDVYPEYNGTGWTVHLKNEDPSQDPQELYDVTSEADLKQNDIKWIGLSPFNDTYGFAANGDLAEAEGGFDFQAMADYLEATPDATVCMETEFPDRPDGLVLFEEATGYKLPASQTQILDTGLIYSETSDGNCDFGEVFTTDGRITALNLELVDDPGVMIVYNSSFTMKNDIYEANAETYDEIADAIFSDLDNDKMAELNSAVDVDGTPAERVAEEYLKDVGLL
ncbi:Putative osmoprotectant uptake system substrate-binding protein OsmF precursor [Nocardioides dokdonensis FR1436]|uniref:Putative osmoprotectant uptake system substrate-binding protein OsmF n=2 Tax=Nocardioides TaxID=1839 RepID=A0A1A9GH13_9ACTN|nr:Putative osmoprotectant uptake system substrate-binding protein OsmF precursor [Nocardioides dokdonensis FR1436]